ncbi:MAG: formylmethanofuran dehydrogenase subunit B [Gammaproteobacteria bacterium]|jgi:formylmethanofuran dehydrogenase subunit B
MKLNSHQANVLKDVPCPFCSLICDDLVVENTENKLTVNENGCIKAKTHFSQALPKDSPALKGKPCSLDQAIEATAKILKQSSAPLLAGLGTDIGGMRSVMQLADNIGATIDHMHSDGAIRNTLVLQDLGWVMTTMSEIKNRADFILFAGTDASNYPRFFERVIWNKDSLFVNTLKRKIVYIGDKLNTSAGKNPEGKLPTVLKCKQEDIGEIISVLHAIIAGNKIRQTKVAGINLTTLQKLAEQMKQAKYGVIVWAPGELDFPHAELTIQNYCELVKYLTRTTRFAGFTLAGNDGGVSANSLSAWQSGFPLRVNFSQGYPKHDANKNSTKNLLQNKEVDSLIWISSFSSNVNPPEAKIPTIVLATPGTKLNFKPDVFIPVATPGIDHAGQLIRTDSVVSLTLKKMRDSEYMSVGDILNRINKLV